jgi:3-oxoacyl-[acyl-carrier protein] reductase
MKQKIVLITGATGTIGKAAALKFARERYAVLIHSNDPEDNYQLIKNIEAEKGLAAPIVADFYNEDQVKLMFEGIKNKWGKIDILINSANIKNAAREFNQENIQNQYFNISTAFLCARGAKDLGCESIVNVGLLQKLIDFDSSFSGSKGLIYDLTMSLAKELSPFCRVNCVASGLINQENQDSDPNYCCQGFLDKDNLSQEQLLENIAEAIFFLAGEKSRFTTGAFLQLGSLRPN